MKAWNNSLWRKLDKLFGVKSILENVANWISVSKFEKLGWGQKVCQDSANRVVLCFHLIPLLVLASLTRIDAHLQLGDTLSAVKEARQELKQEPESLTTHLALIQALAEGGQEIEALKVWEAYKQLGGEDDRKALENLSWGVLRSALRADHLNMRLGALVGAALTRDVRAVPFLQEGLTSSNAHVRGLSCELAGRFGDSPLRKELLRMVGSEPHWAVRLSAIASIGQLRMKEGREKLLKLLTSPRSLVEEKRAAIIALVSTYDAIEENELQRLVQSDRSGLRHLAGAIVSHLELKELLPQIEPLLYDSSPDVRISAINAFTLLEENLEILRPLVDDQHVVISTTACWALFTHGDATQEKRLGQWLFCQDEERRHLVSAALKVSGRAGLSLMKRGLVQSRDPFVRVNLAMGLIAQRQQVALAAKAIARTLRLKGQWMWSGSKNPLFVSLAPSKVPYLPHIPNYPAVVDLMTRLELYSALCMVDYPDARAEVRNFLKRGEWGVTGAATVLLLEEGNEGSLDVIRSLLKDKEKKIRLQAALILALFGNDPEAIEVLHTAYGKSDREMRLRIIEAVGRIGDPSSIPFLLEIFKEPYQILRVAAASALIQTLYH